MVHECQLYHLKNQKKKIIKTEKIEDIVESETKDSALNSSSGSVNTVEAKLIELTMKEDLVRVEERNTDLQKQIDELKSQLTNAEEKLQLKEKRIVQLNNQLIDAVNKKNSYKESTELYEEKLKDLEQELMENLNQEGIRRQEAEYIASKLKKKVAELQFLLDERDQDSDSSYYSDDED